MKKVLTRAALDVLGERIRQQEGEGWTLEHDDRHTGGALARAAASYALMSVGARTSALQVWPLTWAPHWFKPGSSRQDLVKAGALILAEIERLDRAEGGCPECGFEDCLCSERAVDGEAVT